MSKRLTPQQLLALPGGRKALGVAHVEVVDTVRTWSCVIPGSPVPKGRPRFGVRNGRPIAYTPGATASWEAYAVATMRGRWHHETITGPVEALVVAVFARPKSRKRDDTHVTKPDGDNLLKCCLDAAEKAGIVRNDSQAWRCEVIKRYAKDGESPCVIVAIKWGGP